MTVAFQSRSSAASGARRRRYSRPATQLYPVLQEVPVLNRWQLDEIGLDATVAETSLAVNSAHFSQYQATVYRGRSVGDDSRGMSRGASASASPAARGGPPSSLCTASSGIATRMRTPAFGRERMSSSPR